MNALLVQMLADTESAARAQATDPSRIRREVALAARRMAWRAAPASAVAAERIHPSRLARLDEARNCEEDAPPGVSAAVQGAAPTKA